MEYGEDHGSLTWEEYGLLLRYRELDQAQQEGFRWLVENIPLLDRLLSGERLTRAEREDAVRALESRGDWRMVYLLSYQWERDKITP